MVVYIFFSSAVPCAADQHNARSALIEGAKCGAPKEVFVILKPRAAYEEVNILNYSIIYV